MHVTARMRIEFLLCLSRPLMDQGKNYLSPLHWKAKFDLFLQSILVSHGLK